MKGIEKGRKKETGSLFVSGSKKNNRLMGISLPYFRWRSKSIHYMPNSKSGRGSFRHFYFSNITFHFYMYKETMGFKQLSEERCDGGDIITIIL